MAFGKKKVKLHSHLLKPVNLVTLCYMYMVLEIPVNIIQWAHLCTVDSYFLPCWKRKDYCAQLFENRLMLTRIKTGFLHLSDYIKIKGAGRAISLIRKYIRQRLI